MAIVKGVVGGNPPTAAPVADVIVHWRNGQAASIPVDVAAKHLPLECKN